jgi:hypothetical protein
METTTPAPTEKMIRDALLDALRKEGLTAEEGWIAVRAVDDGPSAGMYMVVVAEHAARILLSLVLPNTAKTVGVVGAWLLTESEVSQLCYGAPQDAPPPVASG